MQSARQPIFDLIHEVINSTPPVFIKAEDDLERTRIANQLVKGGYLDGSPALGNRGVPIEVAILDVTIEGRQLYERLQEEIRNSRLAVKAGQTIKKSVLLLFGGVCGMVGGVIGAVVTAVILKKWGLQ